MLDRVKRQNEVFQLIINQYVDTASPVGSRVISKKLGLSSATIRNVMQDLEEIGLIMQPHASAGRIPTEKGYRYYIDSLLRLKRLTEHQVDMIESEYWDRLKSLEELLERTSHILSLITNCAGIAILPKIRERSFKHISFVPLAGRRVLVLLVTASGFVKDFVIESQTHIEKGELEKISNFLNSELYDMTLFEIKDCLTKRLKAERDAFYEMMKKAHDIMSLVLLHGLECDIFLEGTSHILSQPEFKDYRKIYSVMRFLENKDPIKDLLSEDIGQKGLTVHIGRENKALELREFSIVTKEYLLKKKSLGRIGVIGLMRMDYKKVIPLVDFFADRLTKALSELDV